MGAVLGSVDPNNPDSEFLHACISRSCNQAERNYPSFEGELLCVVWALQNLHPLIHGVRFKLITDHRPLLWIMTNRHLQGKALRWQMALQQYDFEVEHRAGVKHQRGDVPSRFPLPSTDDCTRARMDHSIPEPPGIRMSTADASLQTDSLDSFPSLSVLLTDDHTEPLFLQPDPAQISSGIDDCLMASINHNRNSESYATNPVLDHCHTEQGVDVYELYGGTAAGLDMLLKRRCKVRKYYYCDTSDDARSVVRNRLQEYARQYPAQVNSDTFRDTFTLPQDVAQLSMKHISRTELGTFPTMLMAGPECQPFSTAGRMRSFDDPRNQSLLAFCSLFTKMSKSFALTTVPFGYLIENVNMQHNWKDSSIRVDAYQYFCSVFGEPVCLDAARFGARAHRIRNWFQNLAIFDY